MQYCGMAMWCGRAPGAGCLVDQRAGRNTAVVMPQMARVTCGHVPSQAMSTRVSGLPFGFVYVVLQLVREGSETATLESILSKIGSRASGDAIGEDVAGRGLCTTLKAFHS